MPKKTSKTKTPTKNNYRIVERYTGKVAADGFATRQAAKPARDKLNNNSQAGEFVVSRSDEHPRGPSVPDSWV